MWCWKKSRRVYESPCCCYYCCPVWGSVQDVSWLLKQTLLFEDKGVSNGLEWKERERWKPDFLFHVVSFRLLLYIKRLSCRTRSFFMPHLSLNPNSKYCTSTLNPRLISQPFITQPLNAISLCFSVIVRLLLKTRSHADAHLKVCRSLEFTEVDFCTLLFIRGPGGCHYDTSSVTEAE